jgi:hypothetical protein
MAYVRRDKKRNQNGEERVYVSIAHNYKERIAGKKPRSKPKVIANLGREDTLDAKMVTSIAKALYRYQRARFGADYKGAELASGLAKAVQESEPALRVMASRAFGLRVIIEKVWQDLGLQSLLLGLKRQHKMVVDLERIIFAMVLHRLIDPGSKMACNVCLGPTRLSRC